MAVLLSSVFRLNGRLIGLRCLRGIVASVLLVLLLPHIAQATTFTGNPSNYLQLLQDLKAGDTLVLEAGTYEEGLPVYYLNGTAELPIVVTGPSIGERAVFLGSSSWNTVRIRESSYIEIYNLELNGLVRGGDAVNADANGDWAHHITIDNFLIYGYDREQGIVGISTNGCTTWGWVIRNNVITGAGTGMYLGNSPGDNPFINGLIENNVIVDTIGYNIEIKHQNARPDFPSIPSATPTRTIIRNNVFSKAHNASTGSRARPNLLVGHWPLSGAGSEDSYEIYGNFFYQNTVEALFQGEGNLAFYNNVLVNDFGNGINIRPHNDKPRSIQVFNNTVVASNVGISVTGGDSGYEQSVVGNAVFASTPISASVQRDNVTDSYAKADTYLTNPSATIGSLDLFPKQGMLTGLAIDTTPFRSFTDWSIDFNGTPRDGSFRGAYAGQGQNQGWLPKLERKPVTNSSGVPAPILEIGAGSSSIVSGDSVTLTWSTMNATSCVASGAWSGTKDLSGNATMGPLTSDSTYTLTCTGEGGSVVRSVVVTVTNGGGNTGDAQVDITNTLPTNYVWDVLAVGKEVYTDRGYTYASVPEAYRGLDVLRTGNSDKASTVDAFISFDVNQAITVYVAHTAGSADRPSWLTLWTDTGDALGTTDRTLRLYKRDYVAGTVTLGGNGGAASMYTVLVASQGGSGIPPASDGDGDGLVDSWEMDNFGDLTTANGMSDSDGDGLLDKDEYTYGTNPLATDTDGDGNTDAEEVTYGSDPTLGTDTVDNHRPYQPVIPPLGSNVPLAGLFEEVNFGDPDVGNIQGASEWQIGSDANFMDGTLILSRQREGGALGLVLEVPQGILEVGGTYWIRTRHQDSTGLWSSWSVAMSFSTTSNDPNDADGNGVDDRYQVDAGLVDVDGNGTADTEEGMCNLWDPEGSRAIAFYVGQQEGVVRCTSALRLSELPEATQSAVEELPYGLFDFRVENVIPGATVEVTVIFPESFPAGSKWYKYDPVMAAMVDFSSSVTITDRRVVIRLTDGGDGDADGLANGVIVDPSGPAMSSATTTNPTGDATGGGGALNMLVLFGLLILGLSRKSVLSN